ncbi:TetR/AcrR family transcriptional regulator [Streptomyces sp. NPDC017086]|uniref:TetR/AcrR family transcriptional regulator n=1 Tax=Streptomyces sp. NPDC017086 TaxID=3364976 RepID=UPI0037AB5EC5
MSTTPDPAHQPFSASAPVSLTERRKAETRMEIARAAAALFVQRGLRATRAEDIAQAAGIAPRTFYRYFATKEEAVAPLYAAGAQRWTEAVRAAPAGLPLPQILEHAVRHTLTPGLGVSAASWEWLRTLIRLADTSPALRKVWAEVCQASEAELAEILATRTAGPPTREGAEGTEGTPAGRKEVQAGRETASAGRETASAGRETASAGWGETPAGRAPHVVPDAPLTPELRFAAAVASAAVRVAVESWAATTTQPTGPEGPAALAVRNLRALRDFAWNENRGTPTGGR